MMRPLAPEDKYAIQESVVFNAITRVLSAERVYCPLSVRTKATKAVLRDLAELSRRMKGEG